MSNTILHKRSTTPESIPTTATIAVGELAINVNDGKVFLRRTSSVYDDILPIVTANTVTSGSISSLNGFTGSLKGSSSYALTSSYTMGSGNNISNLTTYETISPDASNYITCSFTGESTQQVNLTVTNMYNFTCSNLPALNSGRVADITLFVSHSSLVTSTLTWPSNWIPIGTPFPTYIAPQKVAFLWLRGTDKGLVMGTFTPQS